MSAGNVTRIVAVLAACAAALGSATSSSNQNQSSSGQGDDQRPPAPQQMEATRALGVWRSTFGVVKIEPDASHGGLPSGSVQGIWVYQRQGAEVVGYFAGNLRGNVLRFRWQEPSTPPLTGEGYLVFDAQGRQYSGRWWSDKRDRVGDWSGWRQPQGAQQAGADPGADPAEDRVPGETYPPAPARGAYQRPQPYQQQPYQQQPYQQQPYQQQPYQQQPYQQQSPYQQQPYQQPQPYQPQPSAPTPPTSNI
jgi:hypothetical protein